MEKIVAHQGHISDSEFMKFRRQFKQVCEQGTWNPDEVEIRSAREVPGTVHVPIGDISMRPGIDLTRSLAPSLAQSDEKEGSMVDIASVPSHLRVYDDIRRDYAADQLAGEDRLTDIRHMPILEVETLRAAVADAERVVHDLEQEWRRHAAEMDDPVWRQAQRDAAEPRLTTHMPGLEDAQGRLAQARESLSQALERETVQAADRGHLVGSFRSPMPQRPLDRSRGPEQSAQERFRWRLR